MEPSGQVDAWSIGLTNHWPYDPKVRHFFDLTNHSHDVIQLIGSTVHWSYAWWRHQMETFVALLALQVVRGIHRSLVNSPHKGQWHGALIFSLICTWTNFWINDHNTGDLRRHRAHYDVTVMDYIYAPEVLWIAVKMVISHKNSIFANFARVVSLMRWDIDPPHLRDGSTRQP